MSKEWTFKTNGDTISIEVLNELTLKPTPGYYDDSEADTVVFSTIYSSSGVANRARSYSCVNTLDGYNVRITINNEVFNGNIASFVLTKIIEGLYHYDDVQVKVFDWSKNPTDDQLKQLMDEHHLYPSTEGQIQLETQYMMTSIACPQDQLLMIELNVHEGFDRITRIFNERLPKVLLLGLGNNDEGCYTFRDYLKLFT